MIQSSVDESFTKPRTVGRVGVDGIALDVAERQIGLQFPRLRQRDLRLAETYAREMCSVLVRAGLRGPEEAASVEEEVSRRSSSATQQFGRSRSEADIKRFSVCTEPVAFDPERTSMLVPAAYASRADGPATPLLR